MKTQAGLCGVMLLTALMASGCNSSNRDDYKPLNGVATNSASETSDKEASASASGTEATTAEAMNADVTQPGSATQAKTSDANPPATTASNNAENKTPNAKPSETTATTTDSGAPAPAEQPAASTELKPTPMEDARPPEFRREGPEDALRVSFDDIDMLMILKLEKMPDDVLKQMPQWLRDLEGKRLRMRGFMYPAFEETGLRGFTFVRDENCLFGRNSNVFHYAEVTMRKGKTADYINGRPFDVVGVFHLGDVPERGKLYSLDDAVVILK